MFDRQAQLALFAPYDLPLVTITAVAETADFVTPAKEQGLPPFAVLLQALARASLDVEQFRWRLGPDGAVTAVDALHVSYTVTGGDGNLNFSSFPFTPDRAAFLDRYLADREEARGATALRLKPLAHRDWLFVTCLPWLRFTQIQHPVRDRADCSIPSVAVGRFDQRDGRVSFPLSVQAHHGLVDGIHIARYMARVEEILGQFGGGW